MYDKREILRQVVDQLESNLQVLVKVAHDARDEATHEDSKAENKYDTRGLEASYLAGAQAQRATELKDAIESLRQLELRNYMDGMAIEATALVQVLGEEGEERWFFLLPTQGGLKVEVEGCVIHVITPGSPLGKSLFGKSTGDEFSLTQKKQLQHYEIGEVW